MFAVLKTGGKQYTVRSGDVLRVEKLACEAGETIQFNDVLMVGGQIGAPFVAGAAVQATVIDQIKGEKTIHFVRRRRKHSSKRTKGHRQQLTLVRVTDILEAGADATGVKAAIGTGARPAARSTLQAAAGRVGSLAAATADQAQALAGTVSEQVGTFAEGAAERVETLAAVVAQQAGSAVEQVEAVAGDAVERTQAAAGTVAEAVEDVASTTTGKVALAAAAVAGVAAIAAAVLGGTSATADDAAGADGEADSKE